MGTLVSIIVALIVAAVVLMIVDRLNLGLSVDGFGSAVIAAIVIAIVGHRGRHLTPERPDTSRSLGRWFWRRHYCGHCHWRGHLADLLAPRVDRH